MGNRGRNRGAISGEVPASACRCCVRCFVLCDVLLQGFPLTSVTAKGCPRGGGGGSTSCTLRTVFPSHRSSLRSKAHGGGGGARISGNHSGPRSLSWRAGSKPWLPTPEPGTVTLSWWCPWTLYMESCWSVSKCSLGFGEMRKIRGCLNFYSSHYGHPIYLFIYLFR